MICLLFWLQIFFQIKDEDAVKKYVYFGGIEHSIRKEVRLITQETKLFLRRHQDYKSAAWTVGNHLPSRSLSKNHAVSGGAVLFKKCSYWPCVVVATQAKSGSNGSDLELLQIQYWGKKKRDSCQKVKLNVWCRWNNAAGRKIVLTISVLSPGIHRHHHHLDYTQYCHHCWTIITATTISIAR